MDKMLVLLNNLEQKLICALCENKCRDPVRIITCDHYFCQECLKGSRDMHSCPQCMGFYELSDIEQENMARKTEHLLTKLRNVLEDKGKPVIKSLEKVSTSKKQPQTKKDLTDDESSNEKEKNCTFTYNNKIYHINFVDFLLGKVNPKGETQLHLACKRKKYDIVKKLIHEKSVDINIKDHAGWAPLHEAVQSQDLQIIEVLLKSGCLIDIPGMDYTTPLHQAVSLGNSDIIKLLLKHGADRNAVDYNGLKPIDLTKNQVIKDMLSDKKTSESQSLTCELFLPNKLTIYCHSLDEQQKNKLKSNKNITVDDKLDHKKKPTHFAIKKTHKMSFKILQSMLMGIQFLTQDSVEDFIKGNYFIPIPNYIFLINNESLNAGIRKAMISALLKLPSLFAGLNFFIEHHNSPLSVYNLSVDKDYLGKLINFGGGRLLNRPPALRTCEVEFTHPYFATNDSGTYRCCNFIIYEEDKPPELKYNMSELQHKSSKWLIDCIVNYEIRD